MMWVIYFLGVLDMAREIFGAVAGICFTVAGLLGVFMFIDDSFGDYSSCKVSWLRRCFIAAVIFGTLFVVTPSSKTVAAMYVVPAIVNNEQLQGIAGNSLKALEKLTQKWLKDLAEEAEHI